MEITTKDDLTGTRGFILTGDTQIRDVERFVESLSDADLLILGLAGRFAEHAKTKRHAK